MTLSLVALDCASCGSALSAEPEDILFWCRHCGAGALLGAAGLEKVESVALLPPQGRRAELFKPAWLLEARVAVHDRVRADGVRTQDSAADRTFVIPAFALPLQQLTRLARALSSLGSELAEVPKEPVLGGILSFGDALVLAQHLVVSEQVRMPDMLASVNVSVEPRRQRLAAIPFEGQGPELCCALTGVRVRLDR